MKELRQQVVTVVHAQREASIEIPGSRVQGTEKSTLMLEQEIARPRDSRSKVDRLESPLGFERKFQFSWAPGHVRRVSSDPSINGSPIRTTHKDNTKSGKHLRAGGLWWWVSSISGSADGWRFWTDHPVRAVLTFLMARPPLLSQEGTTFLL